MIILFLITSIYLILILSFVYGFNKIKNFESDASSSNEKFSVIIPFRNEGQNLPVLLQSLKGLSYSRDHFECLFVDDDSSDDSVKIIHQELQNDAIQYQIINNQRVSLSPKKDAILTAINKASYNWVITTDADCKIPPEWLHTFSGFIQKKQPKMVVGPVTYQTKTGSFLENFQLLDFLSLQGSTVGGFGIGKPFLCNGANLAYQKDVFLELEGFDGNSNIASGDDIFLFEKFIQEYPDQVQFLKSKSAIVTTFPLLSWKRVIHQRIRWAAKSSSYQLSFGKFVGVMVFLTNLIFSLSLLALLWSDRNSLFYAIILVSKFLVDFLLIKRTAVFYQSDKKKIKGYFLGSLLYPFFSVYIVIKTLTSNYHWKGRDFKK